MVSRGGPGLSERLAPPTRLLEARDLLRIPLWAGLKLGYAVLPMPVLFRLARFKGLAASVLSRRRGETLRRLSQTLGTARSRAEIRRIARRHFQAVEVVAVARCWPEVQRFAGADACAVEGLHHLHAALAEGKGAILLSAHFGYAQLIQPLLRLKGCPVSLVGHTGAGHRKPQKRTRLGLFVHQTLLRLPSGKHSTVEAGINLRPLFAAFGRNEAVIMMAEGSGAGSRQAVEVLGRPIRMAPGVFTVARATAAPVLPVFVVDGDARGTGFRLEISAPLDLPDSASASEGLSLFAGIYEHYIERYPHLWRWSSNHFEHHARGASADEAWRAKARREHSAAR